MLLASLPPAAANVVRVYLVRHGRTRLNAGGYVQGSMDEPIDARGEKQAQQLKDAFRGVPIDVLVTSELCRTIQTAEHIGFAGKAVRDARFNEMNFGVCEGTLREDPGTQEVMQRVYASWRAGVRDEAYPKGESYGMVCERALGGLYDAIAAEDVRSAVVVTHGRLASILLADMFGAGPQGVRELLLSNCAIAVVDVDRAARTCTCVAFNITEHLGEYHQPPMMNTPADLANGAQQG